MKASAFGWDCLVVWLLAGEVAGCRIYSFYTQQIVVTCLAFPCDETALSMPLCPSTPLVLRSSLQGCTDSQILRAQAPWWVLVWGRHMASVLNSLEEKEKALKKPPGWKESEATARHIPWTLPPLGPPSPSCQHPRRMSPPCLPAAPGSRCCCHSGSSFV